MSCDHAKRNEKTTVALGSGRGVPKTYRQILKRVLHEFNLFLRREKDDSSGFQFDLHFSKREFSNNSSGIFFVKMVILDC